MGSYAKEIEHRAIFNDWNSYSRTIGRLRITGLRDEQNGYCRIGTEVHNRASAADWLLRCYVDGTAYFYPHKAYMFNYKTARSIIDLINTHYRVVDVIEDPTVEYGIRTMQILRRKPVGELSKRFFIKALKFSDFLKNKYNTLQDGEGDDNT